MGKHATSESRKAVREVGDQEAEKIGSGVLPLGGPSSPSMPSVGTRRSTRVFVSKNAPKVPQDGNAAGSRVLRSGKRLTVSTTPDGKPSGDVAVGNYGCAGFFGGSGSVEDTCGRKARHGTKQEQMMELKRHRKEGVNLGVEVPRKVVDATPKGSYLSDRVFGIVYSRKRRRSSSYVSDSLNSQVELEDSKGVSISSSSLLTGGGRDHRRFGIAFARKPRSKKPKLPCSVSGKALRAEISAKQPDISETARPLAETIGILKRYLWLGSMDQVVLVVLLHSTRDTCLGHFTCFLLSILTGMIKKKISLSECAAFVSSKLACGSFSFPGVQFLPLRIWKRDFSHIIGATGAGFCIIFGDRLMSVNFSAFPSLFAAYHLSIAFSSLYLPNILSRYQRKWCKFADRQVNVEAHRFCDSGMCSDMEIVPSITCTSGMIDAIFCSPVLPAKEMSRIVEASSSGVCSHSVISGMKSRKRSRKRSVLRSNRVTKRLLKSHRNSLRDVQSGLLKVDTRIKVHPIHEGCELKASDDKSQGSCLKEDSTKQHALPSPASSKLKRRKSMIGSSLNRIKGSKADLSEAKQSIDLLTCNANILVTESDRCWREGGARVMLELSSSNKWCLAVKIGDRTRFLHKAQEMRPSSFNRFTHAIMWAPGSGWKLEFSSKKDWKILKEMHKECCERNITGVPARVIPIPCVTEVPGYEENLASSFARPDSYIRMVNDEVDRTLLSENGCYEIDSGDENWLKHLNSRSLNADPICTAQVTEESFEKTISAFEKAAYRHPDDVSNQEKAGILCSQFADKDMITSMFDYWNKKRKQKHSALVRVFQGQLSRKREQSVQKPLLRKRRSFKRPGSHVGRGKQNVFFEATPTQDAVLKLRAAEAEANKATDIAIQLRNRAQVLMLKADLATYKSVMALRLAEAIQESESPDLPSILG